MSTQANTTAPTKITPSGADTQSQTTSQVEQNVPVPTESPKTRRVFTLSDDLHEGMLQNELQELYKKIKKPVKERQFVECYCTLLRLYKNQKSNKRSGQVICGYKTYT